MPLGQCQVCGIQEARYKCPKCYVPYCTLACFKSPLHSHDGRESSPPSAPPAPGVGLSISHDSLSGSSDNEASKTTASHLLLQKIAEDRQIKAMLAYKSLRAHLSVLLKLMLDSSITKEPIFDNRKEIANMRLCELRMGGAEENELVEEFVQRVVKLRSEALAEGVEADLGVPRDLP